MTETEAAIAAGAASAAAANAAQANSNPSEEQDQLHGWHLSKKEARLRLRKRLSVSGFDTQRATKHHKARRPKRKNKIRLNENSIIKHRLSLDQHFKFVSVELSPSISISEHVLLTCFHACYLQFCLVLECVKSLVRFFLGWTFQVASSLNSLSVQSWELHRTHPFKDMTKKCNNLHSKS